MNIGPNTQIRSSLRKRGPRTSTEKFRWSRSELVDLPVLGADPAHRAGDRAHHHGLAHDHVLGEPDAGQHRPVSDAGRGEERTRQPLSLSFFFFFFFLRPRPLGPRGGAALPLFSSVSTTSRVCIC